MKVVLDTNIWVSAWLCPITELNVPELRDPDDNIILATAIASQADVIITGVQDLLTLIEYQKIPIMTAKSFLNQWHN